MFQEIQELLEVWLSFFGSKVDNFAILDFTFAKNERHAEERVFSAASLGVRFSPWKASRGEPERTLRPPNQQGTMAREL